MGFFDYKKGKQPVVMIGGIMKMEENELTMPTKYDPQSIEKGRYEWWLEGKFFEAQDDDKNSLTRLSFHRQT